MLYSIGQCPVCGDFGRVLIAREPRAQVLFAFCPACETAWMDPSRLIVQDSIRSVWDVAPAGIELPTRANLVEAHIDQLIREEFAPDEPWFNIRSFLAETGNREESQKESESQKGKTQRGSGVDDC